MKKRRCDGFVHYIFDWFDWLFGDPDRHDLAVLETLQPCDTNRPTDSMLACEESAQMRTAAGMFVLTQYYLGCKCWLRFPRALPIELKGIAV